MAKTTKLQEAPKYLIVKFSRIDYAGKVKTKVRYLCDPVQVDTWNGKVGYSLKALAEHTGAG